MAIGGGQRAVKVGVANGRLGLVLHGEGVSDRAGFAALVVGHLEGDAVGLVAALGNRGGLCHRSGGGSASGTRPGVGVDGAGAGGHVTCNGEGAGARASVGRRHGDAVHHRKLVHSDGGGAGALTTARVGDGHRVGAGSGNSNGSGGLAIVPSVGVARHSRHGKFGVFTGTELCLTADGGHHTRMHHDGGVHGHTDALSVARSENRVISVGRGSADGSGVPITSETLLRGGGQGVGATVGAVAELIGDFEGDGIGHPHGIEVVVGVGLVGGHLGGLVGIGCLFIIFISCIIII